MRVVRGLPRPHGPCARRSEAGPPGPLTADFPPLPCSTLGAHRCAGVSRSPLQTITATRLRAVRALCGPGRQLAVRAASVASCSLRFSSCPGPGSECAPSGTASGFKAGNCRPGQQASGFPNRYREDGKKQLFVTSRPPLHSADLPCLPLEQQIQSQVGYGPDQRTRSVGL